MSRESSSNDLRVPVVTLPVEIRHVDGGITAGLIFVPATAMRHVGPMRADEWVNETDRFFPFLPNDSTQSVLVNKATVLALIVPAGAPGDTETDFVEILPVPERVICIECGGTTFQGVITLDMPANHSRVLDYLNLPTGFLPLRVGDHHHLINKSHITRVIEIRED